MISGALRWYTVGGYLMVAVRDGLTVPVARSGQVPGEIAWDECCDGMLAVAVPRAYFSEEFPAEAESTIGILCQAPYEVGEFTVTVLRCAPVPDGQAVAPTAAELDASAALLLQDMAETMDAVAAVLCSLKASDLISDYLLTPAEAAGPEGGCVGLNLRVLVGLERA
jgi:hypothetical protein